MYLGCVMMTLQDTFQIHHDTCILDASSEPRWIHTRYVRDAMQQLLLSIKIPGMFRGSTETVFMVALPQLIIVDGLLMPTVLPFSVPAIPRAMLVKALYHINNQDTCTHVWIFQEEREDQHSFYVLKKDNEYGAKKITPKLIELFEAARGGVKDKRIKDHASLLAVCDVLGEELQRPSAVRPVVMWCARGWHGP